MAPPRPAWVRRWEWRFRGQADFRRHRFLTFPAGLGLACRWLFSASVDSR